MNYVILDLEWDSAFFKPEKRFINQILQIGAVKLDSELNIVGTFEETIKSSISKKVSKRFAELTGITSEDMLAGVPFDVAVDRYNKWVGDDTVTMTWSNSDLYAIRDNEKSLLSDGRRFKMERYLDLQKFVQGELRINGYKEKNLISLSGAAEQLKVTSEGLELHTAKDDSLLSVAVLKRCYNKERFEALIKNTSNPEFYRRLDFKAYNLSDINDELIDKAELHFFCNKCGAKARRTSKWRYRESWFSAKFKCDDCEQKFVAGISFRKTYDDLKVKKRIKQIRPKTENTDNEMQSVPETVQR